MTEGAAPEKRGVLTKHDIVREEVVRGHCPQNLQPAAYDVRVGHIITADDYVFWDDQQGRDHQGRYRDSLSLKPGETATLASLEEIDLVHKDINALIVPRNRPAQRGLLTLNAGHVDPGHKGFVMAQVVNLTNRPFPLHLLEAYFSIVFFRLSGSGGDRPRLPSTEERLRDLRTNAAQAPVSLGQKESLEGFFVSYDKLDFELMKRVWVFVVGLAALAGVGLGIWQAVARLSP
jgi:deoxycytidine triphosphate deaminase